MIWFLCSWCELGLCSCVDAGIAIANAGGAGFVAVTFYFAFAAWGAGSPAALPVSYLGRW